MRVFVKDTLAKCEPFIGTAGERIKKFESIIVLDTRLDETHNT